MAWIEMSRDVDAIRWRSGEEIHFLHHTDKQFQGTR